ncbi:MAG: molybdopterin-dependent oxidoreductase [Chloroflexi bacterium]|nr:molybdopterin-dependent oxidoreductase [Chloroflexota bacterium]
MANFRLEVSLVSEENSLLKALGDTVMSRRSFLKWSTALGGAAVLSSDLNLGLKKIDAAVAAAAAEGKWIPAACWHNCGGRCPIRANVADGVVIRVKTDDTHPDSPDYPQQRACLRGRSQRMQVLAADRIKYPMKRKNWEPGGGKKELRGKDEWVRISWDEALDIVASETKRIKDKYGNKAIYCPGGGEIQRTLSLAGGYVSNYGSTSRGAWRLGQEPLTGTTAQVEMNDRFDLQNSKLIVMWGNNPAWSSMGLATYNFLQAKRAGAKFIFVDPFYSPTASIMADEWIPIRPATDTTMLLAMAYVMITEDSATNKLIDWDFLNRCTVGFDKDHMPEGANPKENFKDYVLGVSDGKPKTPEWAARICGVPAEKIRSFALEVARTKPAAMLYGWNSARLEKSQHMCFAVVSVGAMTGNMGIPGGAFGISCHNAASNGGPALVSLGSSGVASIANPLAADPRLCSNEHWEAIVSGKYTAGKGPKKDINIQMIYHGGSSKLNQTNNVNKGIAAHRKVEFVVTHQYGLNSNAKYSDLVLPVTTQWERYSNFQSGNRELVVWASRVIQPLFEAKDDIWIAAEVGKRLGLDVTKIVPMSEEQQAFNTVAGTKVIKTDGSAMENLVTITEADIAEMKVTGKPQTGRITLKEFREQGFYAVPRKAGDKLGYIHNQKFREDPVKNPLKTKSGKLQLHSQVLADLVTNAGWNQGYPIAIYDPPTEGYEATFADWDKQVKGTYPLQLCNIHYPRRSHSVLDNVTWLREAWPQELMINPLDAESRGVKHGDTVRIFNKHGSVLRRIFVTPRARPGVVFLGEGAWPEMDEAGNDIAGATNTLSGDYPSGPDIESWQGCVVQVEKWNGKPLEADYKWSQRIVFKEA